MTITQTGPNMPDDAKPDAGPACHAPGPCAEFSLYCRVLPDGRVLHLIPMIYNVRLVIESPEDNRAGCYTDGWCFDRSVMIAALVAAATWDGAGDPPGPWKKNINTKRRGPGAVARDLGQEPAPEGDT